MSKKKNTAPVQSLERGLTILEAVAQEHGYISLNELVAKVGLEKSCVFRMANTLLQRGYLVQSRRSREYSLGSAVFELMGHMQQSKPLLVIARRYLADLARLTGETSHLSVLKNDMAVSLDYQLTGQLVGVGASMGRAEPLHCSAVGKALIADMEIDDLRDLLGGGSLPARTQNTIRTVEKLFEECRSVLTKGYAVDDQEYAIGVRCVAAPVRDFRRDIVAAIGVSAPADRLPPKKIPSVGKIVRDKAELISKELGDIQLRDKA